jgi:pyrroline-5-carboxylate reductase
VTAETDNPPLLIVGGGNMGEAILKGLLASGASPASLAVAEKFAPRREQLEAAYDGVAISAELPAAADVVLAVKPADAEDTVAAVAGTGAERVLSVMAGLTTGALEAMSPRPLRVIRAMPNTPALVGAGAAAITAGASATEDDLLWAEGLLEAVGVVVRVPEGSMDAVTGLSGSGPAYVFLVAEAMVESGVLLGLPRPTAEKLAFQTIFGSAKTLIESPQSAAELRANVTSPGGTTAAGLLALEQQGTRAAFAAAITAAAERSRELGS